MTECDKYFTRFKLYKNLRAHFILLRHYLRYFQNDQSKMCYQRYLAHEWTHYEEKYIKSNSLYMYNKQCKVVNADR